MNIALIGYGKMGKAIEAVALEKNHRVVLKIDIDNRRDFTRENLAAADVAIEFSSPHSAFDNVMICLEAGIPVVCGSTGWLDRLGEAKQYCLSQNGSLIYSSNYSIGVNLFFEVNKKLAALMASRSEYEVEMVEIHHTQKKDAPSGTAITLAEQILEKIGRKKSWINHPGGQADELTIYSERLDPAPGTHKVRYHSPVDDIEIIHTAHNRQGFASGAVLAAEFIVHKKGIYGMNDVLGF